jgi:hypothetical protein
MATCSLQLQQQPSSGDGSDDHQQHHHHHATHQLIQAHHHHHGQDLTGVTVDLNSVAQACQEGQIILTGEDGQAYPVTVSGMITVPVNQSMYQTVVANISSVQQPDGTMQVSHLIFIRSISVSFSYRLSLQTKFVIPHNQLLNQARTTSSRIYQRVSSVPKPQTATK